ncbi:MAG TPA: hypothetical protein VMM38_03595 [Aridibacter sp.]|nr:hypothetical protein [Aridibacter sp.]
MRLSAILLIISAAVFLAACPSEPSNNGEATPAATGEPTEEQTGIRETKQPERILEMMKARGEQDQAKPELTVESPQEGAVIESSTVKVKVKVGGDLKMGKDDSGMGNHVHVILDNQPYAAHYMWDEGFELRNVTDGEHTLRMFPSRPWHQSYKSEGAFKLIRFTVKNGGADETKPTTDDRGNTMADPKADEKKAEGVTVEQSTAGDVDPSKPLLTYSRPKGDYKGEEAEAIMVDFWLSNAQLRGDGGKYLIRCTINDGEPFMIETWAPLWLAGWKDGKNVVKLELIDGSGNPVENGGYNTTSREITVLR